METSMFIAQLFGVSYLAVGLGLLFSKDYYKKALYNIVKNESTIYFGGIMALVTGLTIVHFHNTWTQSWEVIITILGWIALIKGISLLVLPKIMMSFSEKMFKSGGLLNIAMLFTIIIGAVLTYYGFGL